MDTARVKVVNWWTELSRGTAALSLDHLGHKHSVRSQKLGAGTEMREVEIDTYLMYISNTYAK